MNGYSPYPNPYGGRYGPYISGTQGFVDAFTKWRGILGQEQYRQSLMDINRSRLDIERDRLKLARERQEKELQQEPFEVYAQMQRLVKGGMPPELGMRGLAGAGVLSDFSPYRKEFLFPEKSVSPSQQVTQKILGATQDWGQEQWEQAAKRRLFGPAGQAKTTLNIEGLSELMDAEFDQWQFSMPGGVTQTTDVWGNPDRVLSDTFAPDPFEIDSLIDEITDTYSDVTGIPKENLENLAHMRARRRFKNYRGKSVFEPARDKQPFQKPISDGDLDAALKQAESNLGPGADSEQIILEAKRLLTEK